MNKVKLYTMKELIEKVKLRIIRRVEGLDETDRKWLKVKIEPYGMMSQKIEMLILEGSPARGIIIANYGNKKVFGFDAWMTKVASFSGGVHQ